MQHPSLSLSSSPNFPPRSSVSHPHLIR
jgi:serine/threonine protein kinase